MITKQDVENILSDIKIIIENDCFLIKKSEKTKNTLSHFNYEIDSEKITEILKNLTVEDYVSGPSESHKFDNRFQIWVFGKELYYNETYIKLEIKQIEHMIILSFHIAEHELKYKFKARK